MNKETFVKLAREKYGDAFIYVNLPEYITRASEIIVCRKHGEMKMIPRDHLRTKYGCPRCASEGIRKSEVIYNEEMVERAKKKYGYRFDYSEVDLKTNKDMQVKLACPVHGRFLMSLHRHLRTQYGCPGCAHESSVTKRRKYRDLTDVMVKVREIHGDVYECLNYDPCTKLIKYRCSKPGDITRPLGILLSGRGCPDCGYVNRTIDAKECLSRAIDRHFKYRVDNTFYRSFIALCNALNLPDDTSTRCVERYRTLKNLLSPPNQQ